MLRSIFSVKGVRPVYRKCMYRSLSSDIPSGAKDRLDELTKLVTEDKIDTVAVGITDLYGRFMGKRYDAHDFLDTAVKSGSHACNYLLTVDMEMNPIAGFEFANWESGYGDIHMVPDLSTLHKAGWCDKTYTVLCDAQNVTTHKPIHVAPRSVLKRQIDQINALPEKSNLRGGSAKVASELEYYLFKNSYRECKEVGHANSAMQRYGWYSEDYVLLQGARSEPYHQPLRRALRDSGIPVENCKGETGVGQHEINVRYTEALAMADRHIMLKQCMKEFAETQGVSLTFMAKPFHDDAGSSCHIHLSLHDETGKNVFQGEETLGDVEGCSKLFKHFLGGWIHYAPEVFALYAPTVNSYKRFVSGSWAPTACAWGVDNRTAGFRVVGSGKSLRIECRLPGADCNPYLGFAGAIASGLAGIRQEIEPPPMLAGNGYSEDSQQPTLSVPKTLGEAANRFAESKMVKEAFGEEVQQHYAHFYRSEQFSYDKVVTDWERQRYFEQI